MLLHPFLNEWLAVPNVTLPSLDAGCLEDNSCWATLSKNMGNLSCSCSCTKGTRILLIPSFSSFFLRSPWKSSLKFVNLWYDIKIWIHDRAGHRDLISFSLVWTGFFQNFAKPVLKWRAHFLSFLSFSWCSWIQVVCLFNHFFQFLLCIGIRVVAWLVSRLWSAWGWFCPIACHNSCH